MKKIIISASTAIALTACTSNPTYTTTQKPEYRNPSNIGDVLQGSSNVSAELAGSVVHASVTVSEASFNGSKKISKGLWEVLEGSANVSKDVAIIGWNASQDSSAFVIAAVKEVPTLLNNSANYVVATSGEVFQASVNASKTAIGVSVHLAKESGEAVVNVGDFVLGTARLSANVISDSAKWSADKATNAARWSVNAFGELIAESGEVVGHVVDTSGRAIRFALDKTGKFLTISGNASVAVVHGSSEAIEATSRFAYKGLKKSGEFLSATVTFSAQKTAMVFRWSADGVTHSSTVVSNSIKHLLMSSPEARNVETY